MSLRSRFLSVFRSAQVEQELEAELQAHVEMRAADSIDRGMSPTEARHDAMRRFGNMTRAKEDARSEDLLVWLESLWQDLRYGARGLRKSPGFALVASFTLAIGIGANVAIFSIVNSVLLRPVAYPHPEQLVMLWSTGTQTEKFGSSMADIKEWRARNHVFSAIGSFDYSALTLSAPGQEPERAHGAEVTANFFGVLDVKPALGRNFAAEEEDYGQRRVVLLSYGLWQRRFGGDPGIVGRTIRLNTFPYTVVGVMPRGMPFMDNRQPADLFVPLSYKPGDNMATRENHYLNVVARMKPGVTLKQAAAEMNVIGGQLAHEFPENAGMGIKIIPLEAELVGDTQKTLLVLLAAVGFVLLIACVNVANLMLARAARRQREMAVRAAIGARRARVLRQLLTESLLLSFCGAVVGVLLAFAAFSVLRNFLPDTLPRFNEIAIDVNVLLFACGAAVVTALLFGAAPALHASRSDIAHQLKETGGNVTLDRAGKRARSVLMSGELALAAVLLVCAGLTVKSLTRLLGVNPGFDTRNVITFSVPLYGAEYGSTEKAVQSHNQILAQLHSIPGVEAVAYSTDLPLGFGGGWGKLVSFPGRPAPASRADVPSTMFQLISAEYFKAIGTAVVAGRAFTDADDATGQQVAIVNQAFAHKFFGSANPVGKTVLMDAPPGLASTHLAGEPQAPVRVIVGVAADIKDDNGLSQPPLPRVFVPVGQAKGEGGFRTGLYCLRMQTDPMAALASIRAAIHEFDREVPVVNPRRLEELIGISASTQRFTALLLTLFGGVALLMAAIGAYGVISNSVAYRTREIGLRVALGASPAGVLRLVMGDAIRIALVGTAIGLLLGDIASRGLRSMLFEVRPGDPLAFGAVAVGLIATALLASYIPARRATRVDPLTALRTE